MKKLLTTFTATAALTTFAMLDENAEASSTYTVKSGDTLWKIATQNNMSVSQLKSLNNLSSNIIYPNQRLVLNNNSTSTTTRTSTTRTSRNTSTVSTPATSTNTYTVRRGDTLYGIARAHGISYRELTRLNNISSHLIYPGQVLKVSGTSTTQNTSSNTVRNNTQTASRTTSYSAPAPSKVSNGPNLYYIWGSCVWYAFERRTELGLSIGNKWGNAHNWAANARSQGYTVNNRPSVGSILHTHAWSNGAWGLGHVAIVERINYDGSILISEMAWNGGSGVKNFRTIPAHQTANYNYIH